MIRSTLVIVGLLAQTLCAARDFESLIARAAAALEPKLVEMRRDFRMCLGLSNQEQHTSRIVAARRVFAAAACATMVRAFTTSSGSIRRGLAMHQVRHG